MKIGFLFPGQGAQSIGMGKDLYDEYEEIRDIYNQINKLTGIDIAKISFYGSEEELNKTQNTQLAILAMSLGIIEVLNNKKINAEMVTGLSLGEYSALEYSGVISQTDVINIVKKRGEYMQELVPSGDWNMAAIIGLENDKVEETISDVKSGFVAIANYNCDGQIVISGEKDAIEEAAKIAKEKGARKVIVLKTAGPFHTMKLKLASEKLSKDLKAIDFKSFDVSVVKNIDGEIYKDSDNIGEILEKHIISPVKFDKCLEKMKENGIDTLIEIGPGKVLSGFAKRTFDGANIMNINNKETLQNVIEFCSQNN